jgi:uncharacterized protein (DUF4415 family)
MKRYRLDPKKPRELTPEETRRLAKTPVDYSDIPPLGDEFFSQAKRAWPPTKQQVTLRLDADVLSWLKKHGKGYQTRINHILRTAMEGQRPARLSASRTRKRTHSAAAPSRHQPKP